MSDESNYSNIRMHQNIKPAWHILHRYTQQLFHTFIENFFFHIDLKMFTETVPSRRIAMESKAMSIECKTEFHKNDANINAIHIHVFFFIQITDYKNINEILSYALKQRWKYRRSTMTFQHACTALGPNDSNARWRKGTRHVHTHSLTHTLAHTESVIWTSRDETTRSRNNIQRASEGFGFFFF